MQHGSVSPRGFHGAESRGKALEGKALQTWGCLFTPLFSVERCCGGRSAARLGLKKLLVVKSEACPKAWVKIQVLMKRIGSFRSLPAPGQFGGFKMAFPPGSG